jgi:5,10-methenyltetrahydromethanopterin hydrogenase
MITPEEAGRQLAIEVLRDKQEALDDLEVYMKKQGKTHAQYVIVDNWEEVLDSIDKGKPVSYECRAVHKLTLKSLIN